MEDLYASLRDQHIRAERFEDSIFEREQYEPEQDEKHTSAE